MLSNRIILIAITMLIILPACNAVVPTTKQAAATLTIPLNNITPSSEKLIGTLTQTPTPNLPPSPQPTSTDNLLPTPSPTEAVAFQVNQLRMFDKDQGWAIGEAKQVGEIITNVPKWILKTIDGGKNWMKVSNDFPQGCYPKQAFFWDIDNAFTICDIFSETQTTKREYYPFRTSDGGRTWQSGEVLTIDFNIPFSPIQLFFLDQNQGWFIGFASIGHADELGYGLFETKDGGMHWQMVSDPLQGLDSNNIEAYMWGPTVYPFQMDYLVFISPTVGFRPKRGHALIFVTLTMTQDGGKSWTPQSIDPPADEVPVEKQHYGQFVSVPQFITSTDGVLIQQIYISNEPVDAYGRFIDAPDVAFLQYTNDSGQTWTPQIAPAKMGDVTFLNQQIGWYLGKDNLDPTTHTNLFQTVDGGKIWSVIAENSSLPLGSKIQFVDELNGFALYSFANAPYFNPPAQQMFENTYLFSTTDGGHSWTKVEPQLAP